MQPADVAGSEKDLGRAVLCQPASGTVGTSAVHAVRSASRRTGRVAFVPAYNQPHDAQQGIESDTRLTGKSGCVVLEAY
jgi:hypothetical protein